jgi:hypothetical protein
MADGQLTEQVAGGLEEAAEITRGMNTRGLGLYLGGLVMGAGIGFYIGNRIGKKKSEEKWAKFADKEVNFWRDFYQEEAEKKAGKVPTEKPSAEQIVEEKGYTVERKDEDWRTKPPVVVKPATVTPYTPEERAAIDEVNKNVFEEAHPNIRWDYEAEIKLRDGKHAYVIHLDEFRENDTYENSTYTYYEEDDVLSDERDTAIDDVDGLVGVDNLQRWGHGSNDINCVYIRNDELQLDIEILRSPGSYAEEVHGLKHSDDSGRRRRRPRGFDDE